MREESIIQINTLLEHFRSFFPEHKDKTVYGILAAVDITPTLKGRVLDEGIYLARIHNEVFTMETPEAFQAKAYWEQKNIAYRNAVIPFDYSGCCFRITRKNNLTA